VNIQPSSLATLKIANYKSPDKVMQEKGIFYSNVPFSYKQDKWYFEAPMESYRFVKQHVKYRDEKNNVYMMVDPYDEIEVEFIEKPKEGDFRIFNASVYIPATYKDRNIRLITLWNTSRQYGVGGCILADNYEYRADEPVSLIINGVRLDEYTFDISKHVKYGEENALRLEVLAEEPPDDVLVKRSSVFQYLTYDIEEGQRTGKVINAGFFEDISRSFLRIGKIIDHTTVLKESYCMITNPDFSSGTLNGWETEGKIKVENNNKGYGMNYFARLAEKSKIAQQIDMDPGLYYLKINAKDYDGLSHFGIIFPNGERVSGSINAGETWGINTILFNVPENSEEITIFAENKMGEVLIDDFRIIANRVAKKIPVE
jgi:hypothetical protein